MKLTQALRRIARLPPRNAAAAAVSPAAPPRALREAMLFYDRRRALCDVERLATTDHDIQHALAAAVLAFESAWAARVTRDDGVAAWVACNLRGVQELIDRAVALAQPEEGGARAVPPMMRSEEPREDSRLA